MSIKPIEEKTLFVVMVNTDLTEGRGYTYVLYHCTHESTAVRLSKGRDVQGTNGEVRKVIGYEIDGVLYTSGGLIHGPTDADLKEEKRLALLRQEADNRARVLAKAKELGLSDEDLAVLSK